MDRLRGQNLEILVGTNNLTKGGKYYKVENFTTHEHFNSPIFAYDIAVIKLQEKIEFNDQSNSQKKKKMFQTVHKFNSPVGVV